jgi:small subunit ribosomal protein S6
MRKYETIYIVQPDLGEEDIKALSEKVQEVITGMKGDCRRLEDWGSRKLAYPVKKQTRGRYFYLNFEGDPALIAELERRLRLDDRVLRYQSVKLDKELQAPAPVVEKPVAEEAAAEPAAETATAGSAE